MSSESRRTVAAPPPSPASVSLPQNRVLSVTLEADEEVEWNWMHTADGVSYVSGYTVVKRAS